MNSLRDSFFSLRDSFMQLPLPTRVIAGAMVALIGIGLWLLTNSYGNSSKLERLFTSDSLTNDEITKILSAFSSARLNEWDVQYNHIYVPANARDEYFRAVEAADALPLQEGSILGKIQEQASPFYSDSSRLARESHAKEMDLGKKISEFPQVLRASVEHDFLNRGFSSDRKESASVMVKPVGSAPLPAPLIRAIKEMVGASYAGMTADDVVVTDVNSRGMSVMDEENPLFQARMKYEEYYTTKAQQILMGFGPLSIDATVEIDPTMETEKAKITYDPQGTTVVENSGQTTTESTRPLAGGVPGTATNALGNKAQSIDPAATQMSKTSQKSESATKVTGEQFEQSKSASFQPKRVSYSVGVPESYYDRIWKEEFLQNPGVTMADFKPMTVDERARLKQDTAEKIKNALSPSLLPVAAGEDKFPLIEVWDHRDLPELPMEEPSTKDLAMTWLAKSWQTIALLVLAMVALLVARGVGKMGTAEARPDFQEGFGLEIPKPPAEQETAKDGESGPKLTITGQNMKQELSELVGTNPEAAANVLRKWLETPAAA
jgi:flagellar M-ring protein FliF